MLELIFVIVILGIVASIGSELIARVFESYIVQRAEHRATLKTELAATQIANRLISAIPGTVFRIRKDTGNYEPLEENLTVSGDLYKGIQWVGADREGYNMATPPAWSGFCDLENSSTTKLTMKTPGSNLSLITTLMTSFGYNNKFAIYFPYDSTPHYVNSVSSDIITFDNNVTHMVEHYKLARTSYALICENGGANYCGDLTLYYNFIPTPTINYSTATQISKSILLRNVTTFKFKGSGRTIRFKICKEERISEDVNITACKEKAVF